MFTIVVVALEVEPFNSISISVSSFSSSDLKTVVTHLFVNTRKIKKFEVLELTYCASAVFQASIACNLPDRLSVAASLANRIGQPPLFLENFDPRRVL